MRNVNDDGDLTLSINDGERIVVLLRTNILEDDYGIQRVFGFSPEEY